MIATIKYWMGARASQIMQYLNRAQSRIVVLHRILAFKRIKTFNICVDMLMERAMN